MTTEEASTEEGHLRDILHEQTSADPLECPDAYLAADAATTENLLRCWLREQGCVDRPLAPAADGVLRIELVATGARLEVPVLHWSTTGRHRFGLPALDFGVGQVLRPDAVTLAALFAGEATAADRDGGPSSPGWRAADPAPAGTNQGDVVRGRTELIGRVGDSVQQTALHLAHHRAAPGRQDASPFLDGEQSLVLGHPLHPTPNSLDGLTTRERHRYAPQLRGSFPLHWFAVDRCVLAADSAWTERGRTIAADRLTAVLAGPGLRLPRNTTALPLHPWQAADVLARDEVRRMLDQELLFDLGAGGAPWHPTSSVRTVHQPGTPAMLKLSLALGITNSRRENLRKELHRGVEVHRLLRTGLANEWRAAFPQRPGFDIVRDPAWLAVDGLDGSPVPGLDVVIRHNPFGPQDQAVCLAALTSPRPWPDSPPQRLTSRLARIVRDLSGRTGRSVAAVSVEWLLRYLRAVVQPVLWLDAVAGVALEAHQQNTIVLLDAHGWPNGGRYRDNQGYYLRLSRRPELEGRLPEIGVASDSFVDDAVTDERFAYYLGVNNVFGLIGAFGAEGLADEDLLLAAFRRFLTSQANAVAPSTAASALPALLLHSPTLRCKANLLTRLNGLDELVGPVDTQSVYVELSNPLARP